MSDRSPSRPAAPVALGDPDPGEAAAQATPQPADDAGAAAAALAARWPSWCVPDFRLEQLRPRRTRYCVCVFVYNEGARIRAQLWRMAPFADILDIIVADGGSADGALAPEFVRDLPVRALLVKRDGAGLSGQMRMALAYAMDEGYEGAVVVDGNGKDDVSALPEFVRLLEQGYDHVQGSRFIPGGRELNTPRVRLLAIRALHAPLMSLAARRRLTDSTNGFRAYSRRLVCDERVAVFRDVFQTYELHVHLALESARDRRFNVTETPVTRSYPPTGPVPTHISPIRGNLRFLVVLLKATTGRYRLRPDGRRRG